MASTVLIKRGLYRGQTIVNKTFTLLKDYTPSQTGMGFVTVDGTKLFGRDKMRVKVNKNDYKVDSSVYAVDPDIDENDFELEDEISEPEVVETDAEILARINERFAILAEMTMGARNGDLRSIFVTGAPGVGKTFIVEKTLEDSGIFDILGGEPCKFEMISGAMTPVGLYCKLYAFRDENQVLVLDDCDDVFEDMQSMNLLKAALDTSKRRMIHWNVDSVSLRKDDVPNQFEYKGSIIFISNINFKKVKQTSKRRPHLEALMSRSHFLDLTVHTDYEKMLRIEDLVLNTNMLQQFKLEKKVNESIMKFVRENASKFNEFSLRTVIKLAGLAKTFPDNNRWQTVAKMSMIGNKIGE
jgi:hypothetical protein